ncbi:ankyrin repeat domain-containing protein [Orientia tsutsugamushi]|uniref:ankyrin repeat domain-containing protein n=1 Tax=Orientia tsutsugamushi TaxID=784 RepID=UPI00352831AF
MPKSERRLHNDIKKAIKGKGIDKIQYLINKDSAIVNAKDKYGCYPLHVAAKYGKEDIANYLLDNGAEIDAKDSNGQTALHYAIKHFRIDAAKFLILHKADINAKDYDGYTPLHIVQSNWFICQDAIHFLLDSGANINEKDTQGNTILYHAIKNYNFENVYHYHIASEKEYKFSYQAYIADLLERNADVNDENNAGETPLRLAVNKNYAEIVEIMLKHCSTIKDDQNMPPIDSTKSRNLMTEYHDANTSYAEDCALIEKDKVVDDYSTIESSLSGRAKSNIKSDGGCNII